MIVRELVNPKSIVVVGGSSNLQKAGGKVLYNLINGTYKGDLSVINPKETSVQGIRSYTNMTDLPQTDLAILAIAAKYCEDTIQYLAEQKGTKGFIILSAGFAEEGEEGAKMEEAIAGIVEKAGGSLIGPNCIGVLNQNYQGVFTTPIPVLDARGCDFISGSGGTAVFIMEAGIPNGLKFSSVYSVGNSAQVGVEEVLQHLDETFDPAVSSRVKLLYIENIDKPDLLLKHASSLIRKGCRIAAIKAGTSEAGSRAASSHTGALASSDTAVDALLRKAGIVRCYSREELTTVACVFMHKPLTGKNLAIITHAGGPAVMLTDTLSEAGLVVPRIDSPEKEELLEKLHPGSSVANPIDFLATGTADQLREIIDYCDRYFHEIDAMVVIFGSPGLFPVNEVYEVIYNKMKTCRKPIFPVLPSVINAREEIAEFLGRGQINFPDEVALGRALSRIILTPSPVTDQIILPDVDHNRIDSVINDAKEGFLSPDQVGQLLDSANIPRITECYVKDENEAVAQSEQMGFPVVMKVIGPIHKTDIGGVVLGIHSGDEVVREFRRMIQLPEVTSVLIQPMLRGLELFAGLKREPKFGTLVFCGLGGIFVEVMKDVSSELAPLTMDVAHDMIRRLRGSEMLKGVRGQDPVNETRFAGILVKLSALATACPEIEEMDLNPLIGSKDGIWAVDARIKIGES